MQQTIIGKEGPLLLPLCVKRIVFLFLFCSLIFRVNGEVSTNLNLKKWKTTDLGITDDLSIVLGYFDYYDNNYKHLHLFYINR